MSTENYTAEQVAAGAAFNRARKESNRAYEAYRDASWLGIPHKVAATLLAQDAADKALEAAGARFSASFALTLKGKDGRG